MAGGRAKVDNTPIDAELKRAGGYGRFQVYITCVVVFGIMSVNLLTHGISILELPPIGGDKGGTEGFICTETDGQFTYSYVCGPADFCPNEEKVEGISYDVDYEASKENIYNWFYRLDLVCSPSRTTSLIATSCMVGIFLGVLIIPRLGDLVGRKPVFFGALIASIPALLLVSLTSKPLWVDIGAFAAGPTIIARMSCGFLMLMEHMETKNQAKVGAVIMVSEGLCQVIWVIYLSAISNDTFYFMYFAISLNVVTAILCYWVPESPRYLYGINNLEKCQEVLTYIAHKNGIKDYQAPKFDVEYTISAEDLDRDVRDTRPSEPGKNQENFDSLLSKREKSQAKVDQENKAPQVEVEDIDRRTTTMGRYQTVAKVNNPAIREGSSSVNRLTKRETVAYMHATVTGIRQTGAFWVIGADRSQSIALDEIFSKKPVHDGAERATVTLRTTRTTKVNRESGIGSPQLSQSDEDEDLVEMEVPTSVMRGNGLCKGRTAINLIFMIILWVCSCVDYGMINIYMKYVPGTIFLNFSVSGLSEILAHVVVGIFYVKLTPRWTFFIGYAVALIGGVLLVFQKRYEDNGALVAIFVLLAKFGISMAMCACYVSTPYIFPVLLSGTAFGICNTFGRFGSIFAPYIAEVEIPFPMEAYSVMALIGLVACLFIDTNKEEVVPVRSSQGMRKSSDAGEAQQKLIVEESNE